VWRWGGALLTDYRVGGTLDGGPDGWLLPGLPVWSDDGTVLGSPVGWSDACEFAWVGSAVGSPPPAWAGLSQSDWATPATAWPCAFGLADGVGVDWAAAETQVPWFVGAPEAVGSIAG
jgi:hypothetical protein